jgi:hypothetical protein
MLTRLIRDEADRIVTWSTAWKCSATTVRWRAGRSTSIPCSTTSNGWRSPASPATSASSRLRSVAAPVLANQDQLIQVFSIW